MRSSCRIIVVVIIITLLRITLRKINDVENVSMHFFKEIKVQVAKSH